MAKKYPFLGEVKAKKPGGKCIICGREGSDRAAEIEVNIFRGDDDRVLFHSACGQQNVLLAYQERAAIAGAESAKIEKLARHYGYEIVYWLESNRVRVRVPGTKDRYRELTLRELLLALAEAMAQIETGYVTDTNATA